MLNWKRVFVGYNCNNNCCYCPYKELGTAEKDLKQIKKEILKARKSNCENILLYGGEPTIRDDFFEILDYIKELDFQRVKLQTNGRMFYYRHFADNVAQRDVNQYCIKIAGADASTHDSFTGIKGSFEQTIEGIRNIKEAVRQATTAHIKPFIQILFFVAEQNREQLPDVAKTFTPLGVDHVILSVQDRRLDLKTISQQIRKGIDTLLSEEIWVSVEGVPFCIMKDYEYHVQYLYDRKQMQNNQLFLKSIKCNKCVYRKICRGLKKVLYDKNAKYLKTITRQFCNVK